MEIPISKKGKFSIRNEGDIRKLCEGDLVWMTDGAVDTQDMKNDANKMFGNVAVFGLGLGIIVKELCKRASVKRVLVVEKSRDVIDLVWPNLGLNGKAEVICEDAFEYLLHTKERFDWCYGDIYRETTKQVYYKTVVLFRVLAGKVADNVLVWGQDRMKYG